MGMLITAFFDELAFLKVLQSGNGTSQTTADRPDSADVAASVDGILANGIREETTTAAADIYALLWLCRHRCELAGTIDHFRYAEEDFKELASLQFGDNDSPLRLPVALDTGLPAVNHWTVEAIRELAESMEAVDLTSRPEYTHNEFGVLKRWVVAARGKCGGLFVFTEG